MRSATYIYAGTNGFVSALYKRALSAIKIEVMLFLTAQFGRCAPCRTHQQGWRLSVPSKCWYHLHN